MSKELDNFLLAEAKQLQKDRRNSQKHNNSLSPDNKVTFKMPSGSVQDRSGSFLEEQSFITPSENADEVQDEILDSDDLEKTRKRLRAQTLKPARL